MTLDSQNTKEEAPAPKKTTQDLPKVPPFRIARRNPNGEMRHAVLHLSRNAKSKYTSQTGLAWGVVVGEGATISEQPAPHGTSFEIGNEEKLLRGPLIAFAYPDSKENNDPDIDRMIDPEEGYQIGDDIICETLFNPEGNEPAAFDKGHRGVYKITAKTGADLSKILNAKHDYSAIVLFGRLLCKGIIQHTTDIDDSGNIFFKPTISIMRQQSAFDYHPFEKGKKPRKTKELEWVNFFTDESNDCVLILSVQ